MNKLKIPQINTILSDEEIQDDVFYEDDGEVKSCSLKEPFKSYSLPLAKGFEFVFQLLNDTIGEILGTLYLSENENYFNIITLYETEVFKYETREELKTAHKKIFEELLQEYKNLFFE